MINFTQVDTRFKKALKRTYRTGSPPEKTNGACVRPMSKIT